MSLLNKKNVEAHRLPVEVQQFLCILEISLTKACILGKRKSTILQNIDSVNLHVRLKQTSGEAFQPSGTSRSRGETPSQNTLEVDEINEQIKQVRGGGKKGKGKCKTLTRFSRGVGSAEHLVNKLIYRKATKFYRLPQGDDSGAEISTHLSDQD